MLQLGENTNGGGRGGGAGARRCRELPRPWGFGRRAAGWEEEEGAAPREQQDEGRTGDGGWMKRGSPWSEARGSARLCSRASRQCARGPPGPSASPLLKPCCVGSPARSGRWGRSPRTARRGTATHRALCLPGKSRSILASPSRAPPSPCPTPFPRPPDPGVRVPALLVPKPSPPARPPRPCLRAPGTDQQQSEPGQPSRRARAGEIRVKALI